MKINIILKKLILFISIYTSCITFGYAANPEVHAICSLPEDTLSCLPVEFRGAWPWYDHTLQISGSDTVEIKKLEIDGQGGIIANSLGHFSATLTAAYRAKLQVLTIPGRDIRVSSMTIQVFMDGESHEVVATIVHLGAENELIIQTSFDGQIFPPLPSQQQF